MLPYKKHLIPPLPKMDMKKIVTLVLILNNLFALAQSDVIAKPKPIPLNLSDTSQKSISLGLTASIGMGLIRNILSPQFNVELHYTSKKLWQVGVNTSSYFLFKKDASNDYKTYLNTFINGEFKKQGAFICNAKNPNNSGGLGVGYLLQKNGNYFKGNTFKIYYIKKLSDIEILPEFILTNNFKSIFPGVAIRF